jgi:hypothetical protein
MPSNISRARLTKAFIEGRRSALDKVSENPYANPKLRELWDRGRSQQLSGELKTPIPPLEHGKTRARSPNQVRAKQQRPKPPLRPRGGGGFRDREGYGGGYGGGGQGGGGQGGGGYRSPGPRGDRRDYPPRDR